jgi:hypothetical protein
MPSVRKPVTKKIIKAKLNMYKPTVKFIAIIILLLSLHAQSFSQQKDTASVTVESWL